MKARPILFSGPMVRALLEGRKTQTRRVMKQQPDDDAVITVGEIGTSRGVAYVGNTSSGGLRTRVPCPYGLPGDLLWVRESWSFDDIGPEACKVKYLIDGIEQWMMHGGKEPKSMRIFPPMHMPRWASRLTLHIIDVRVEHLAQIGEEDAIAEGYAPSPDAVTARAAFLQGDWARPLLAPNPRVWVVTFDVIKDNVDEVRVYISKAGP